MSTPNNRSDEDRRLSEKPHTARIAQALGADAIYPLTGGMPGVIDIITRNTLIDRTRPVYTNQNTEEK